MIYEDYKASRDMTWKLLIKHNICSLPVKVSDICLAENIKILSYEKGEEIIKKLNLSQHCTENDGFTVNNVIFYNQKCAVPRQRFTVAHELGHIMLHHSGSVLNREPSPNDDPIEQAANVFASRLLAPACVLWGLGVKDAKTLAQICDISITSAEFRMARMNELYERNESFKQERGYECFLLSPLERKVHEQFKPYITSFYT